MRRRSIIITLLSLHPIFAYSILFFGMMIEGDLFLFTAGFLSHRGALNLWLTATIAFAGTLIGDALWYRLGQTDTTRNKFLAWLGRTVDTAGKPIDLHINERTFRTLFLSKFVYGVHHFTLVRAGRMGVKFSKFLRLDALAALLWIVIVGGLGYLASASFESLRHRLHFVEIALLIGILAYFLIAGLVGQVLKKRL